MGEFKVQIEMPMLHCDSQSAIMLSKNPIFHAKTKNIAVKYHFIEEAFDDKHVELLKVHKTKNPTYLLTKGPPRESFSHCCELMGIG